MISRKYQALIDISTTQAEWRFPLDGDSAKIKLRSLGHDNSGGIVQFQVSIDGYAFTAPSGGAVAITTLDEPIDVSDVGYPFGRLIVTTPSSSMCVVEAQVSVRTEE